MAKVPANPKIYHITHVRNLPQIVEAGVLWSDAKRNDMGLECDVVGMAHVKRRRLLEIEVTCHVGTHVGDYVPFYFCPRSIMLYILYMGNHPDLHYTEGQESIVHLQADLHSVIEWAERERRRWAFSDRNAGTYLAKFFTRTDHLTEINWTAIASADFRDMVLKEGKQAEFLVYESFPWPLIERIGVCNDRVADQVHRAIIQSHERPQVTVKREWYY